MSEYLSEPLQHLDKTAEQAFIPAQDAVANVIESAWKRMVREVGAYRSGAYYLAVEAGDAISTTSAREIIVEAPGIDYSDLVERGRQDGSVSGRFPAQLAIEQSEGQIEDALNDAGRSLQQRIKG